MVRAYLSHTRQGESGTTIDVEFTELKDDFFGWGELSPGEVELDVLWSSLNYKDAMLLTGRPGVSRAEWIVPGIDVVGRIRRSASRRFRSGEDVLLNGHGLGETRHGGLAERCRVRDDMLLRVPQHMTARDAAAIGTAGYTAALAVLALTRDIKPEDGEILVTGAVGGVGSVAVALLSALGYRVTASSGRGGQQDGYLRGLGAARIIPRDELGTEPGKPLQSARWAGVIDVLGSATLANAIAQTERGGIVASCGLAQGPELPVTVMPFILRGVMLRGIDSVEASLADRTAAWKLLDARLDRDLLTSMTSTVNLAEAQGFAPTLLRGQVRGRIAVRVLG